MIQAEHLHKYFGSIRAVDNVSFNIAKGEVVGLLGPNGAGKTTTMRVITGYLAADSGNATIDGIPISIDPIDARRKIGYLPENAPLYLDMEVTDYLAYIAKLRKIGSSDVSVKVKKMVSTCGLGDVIGRPIGQLSKGFRQRVGLAAAMIHEPPILILDEPTSGLDPNQIVEIRELIREIGNERTVVLSTHIMQEVEATCSRALIISNGKLVGQGTINELLNKGKTQSNYTITVKARPSDIESAIMKLQGLKISQWQSAPTDDSQRLTVSGNGVDRAGDIFKWAVGCGFVLTELTSETASLEDVFRELTK